MLEQSTVDITTNYAGLCFIDFGTFSVVEITTTGEVDSTAITIEDWSAHTSRYEYSVSDLPDGVFKVS